MFSYLDPRWHGCSSLLRPYLQTHLSPHSDSTDSNMYISNDTSMENDVVLIYKNISISSSSLYIAFEMMKCFYFVLTVILATFTHHTYIKSLPKNMLLHIKSKSAYPANMLSYQIFPIFLQCDKNMCCFVASELLHSSSFIAQQFCP